MGFFDVEELDYVFVLEGPEDNRLFLEFIRFGCWGSNMGTLELMAGDYFDGDAVFLMAVAEKDLGKRTLAEEFLCYFVGSYSFTIFLLHLN